MLCKPVSLEHLLILPAQVTLQSHFVCVRLFSSHYSLVIVLIADSVVTVAQVRQRLIKFLLEVFRIQSQSLPLQIITAFYAQDFRSFN